MKKTIKLTDFALRHFDSSFKGTKIIGYTSDLFEKEIMNIPSRVNGISIMKDGYADFCKLLFIENFTNTKTGTMPITMENAQYLQSDYVKRTSDEKAVLSRYFNLPSSVKHLVPVAKYLMIVLYTKEHIDLESEEMCKKHGGIPVKFDADYGIVSINAQMMNSEEPMNPITMMRNALGKEEGGSGFPMDDKKYDLSVEFWSKNAMIG